MLTSVLVAFALIPTTGLAQSLTGDVSVGVGETNVTGNVDATLGSGGTSTTGSVDASIGSGSTATTGSVDATVGTGGSGGTTGSVSADVGTGGGSTTGSVDATLGTGGSGGTSGTANATLGTGTAGTSGTANLNLNAADGVDASLNISLAGIPTSDPLRSLDVNADGRLNFRDDINDDGVINRSDARMGAGTATASRGGASGAPGATGAGAGSGNLIGSLAALSPSQLRGAINSMTDSDVEKIKKACAEILSSPGAEDQSTVAVCEVIASL